MDNNYNEPQALMEQVLRALKHAHDAAALAMIVVDGWEVEAVGKTLDLTPSKIIQEVARLTKTRVDDLRGKDRQRKLCNARNCVMKVMRYQGYSYPEIGDFMNRHHTSVMASCKRPSDKRHREIVRAVMNIGEES